MIFTSPSYTDSVICLQLHYTALIFIVPERIKIKKLSINARGRVHPVTRNRNPEPVTRNMQPETRNP